MTQTVNLFNEIRGLDMPHLILEPQNVSAMPGQLDGEIPLMARKIDSCQLRPMKGKQRPQRFQHHVSPRVVNVLDLFRNVELGFPAARKTIPIEPLHRQDLVFEISLHKSMPFGSSRRFPGYPTPA